MKPISDITIQDDGLFYVELNGEKDDSIFSLKGNMKIESMSLKNISVKFIENDVVIIEPDIPDTIDIVVGSPYIPDASSWYEKAGKNLKITHVEDGKAYKRNITTSDIVVGSPYIPDASSWYEEVGKNLKITHVEDGKGFFN